MKQLVVLIMSLKIIIFIVILMITLLYALLLSDWNFNVTIMLCYCPIEILTLLSCSVTVQLKSWRYYMLCYCPIEIVTLLYTLSSFRLNSWRYYMLCHLSAWTLERGLDCAHDLCPYFSYQVGWRMLLIRAEHPDKSATQLRGRGVQVLRWHASILHVYLVFEGFRYIYSLNAQACRDGQRCFSR